MCEKTATLPLAGGGGGWYYDEFLACTWSGCPKYYPNYNGAYQYWCDNNQYSTGPCPAASTTPLAVKNVGVAQTCAGNPINVGFQTKFQVETDYDGAGPGSLRFQRFYSSYAKVQIGDRVGSAWRHTYARSVKFVADSTYPTASVYRPDGKVYSFALLASVWTPDSDITDSLVRLVDASGNSLGWRYTNSDEDVELYDVAGKLTSITSRSGIVQTLSYSDTSTPTNIAPAPGLLIQVVNQFGRQLSFIYDASSRLKTITDPAGGLYQYGYDANNNLISVTYPDGEVRQYLYNEQTYTQNTNLPHALTGIADENGSRFATFKYDSSSRAISTEHAGGVEKYSISYGTNQSIVTDPLLTARTYNFTTVLGVVKSTGASQPAGAGSSACSDAKTYDANGNVATRTDFNGNVTRYSYDLSRNLETSRTEAYGTALARTITTQWHPTYRLPTQIDEPGRRTTFAYDTVGNLLTKTVLDTATSNSRTWAYTYNAYGEVLTVDGPRTDVSDITTYTYYASTDPGGAYRMGDLATVQNAAGHITQITQYDANGRPLTIIDPNGLVTTLTYAPRGWLASRSVGGLVTTYAYDNVGQLTRVTLPNGAFLSYTYDAAHRLTDIADQLGNHIHYTLDAIGNRTREDVYDPLNNLAQTRSHVFDALNRLWKDIGGQNQTTVYGYDNNGNLTSVADPLNHTTVNAYDALNRLVQVTDPGNGVTRYGYNLLDQLVSVTDPRNLATTYSTDALGNVSHQQSPDTGGTNKTYDAAGNVATSTDAKGQSTSYQYDALNRLTQITRADSSVVTFQYDQGLNQRGRLTTMSDPSGTTTWVYDLQGRVVQKSQTVAGRSLVTNYGYDATGQMTSLTLPSGKAVGFTWANGQIAGVTVNGTPIASSLAYQPFGAPRSWSFGNGQAVARSFDLDGRMASDALASTIGYDAASRLTGITLGNLIL